ncbi:MAG: orotidine-5'-phosphate decarboxylase [Planctomycetota bacterium]|nr:orotidine-5'-phosphate decarboxylase [Planctomycetota bacterium]
MTIFGERLLNAVRRCRTPVLVGLDPRRDQLPPALKPAMDAEPRSVATAYAEFCRGVIDVVAASVPAVKPQAAFFEQLGAAGMVALAEVINYARAKGLLVILDGKRNDIGSTAAAYADAYLGQESPWGADALTVNPYLGSDSLEPFVEVAQQRESGIFVLVKTSNPGSHLLQDLVAGEHTIYQRVAAVVEQLACQTREGTPYGSVGAVVGATYPEQLAELRRTMPHTWLLVPGFGAQGGSAADVAGAFDHHGGGAIINSSRAIIFAHHRNPYQDRYGPQQWQRCVEEATRDMVQQLAAETAAGSLFNASAP